VRFSLLDQDLIAAYIGGREVIKRSIECGVVSGPHQFV
jgi:hypothetical protein